MPQSWNDDDEERKVPPGWNEDPPYEGGSTPYEGSWQYNRPNQPVWNPAPLYESGPTQYQGSWQYNRPNQPVWNAAPSYNAGPIPYQGSWQYNRPNQPVWNTMAGPSTYSAMNLPPFNPQAEMERRGAMQEYNRRMETTYNSLYPPTQPAQPTQPMYAGRSGSYAQYVPQNNGYEQFFRAPQYGLLPQAPQPIQDRSYGFQSDGGVQPQRTSAPAQTAQRGNSWDYMPGGSMYGLRTPSPLGAPKTLEDYRNPEDQWGALSPYAIYGTPPTTATAPAGGGGGGYGNEEPVYYGYGGGGGGGGSSTTRWWLNSSIWRI